MRSRKSSREEDIPTNKSQEIRIEKKRREGDPLGA